MYTYMLFGAQWILRILRQGITNKHLSFVRISLLSLDRIVATCKQWIENI